MDLFGQPTAPLDASEKLARLQLIRSENVGPVTFRQLISRFGNAQAALEALPHMARRGGLSRQIRLCSKDRAEAELHSARKMGAQACFWGAHDYPKYLAAIDDAPPLFYILGHRTLLDRPMIAVVGSRNASTIGRRIASDISRDLGAAGYVIVSGLARGIDGAAHSAGLGSGTAAVLAGGVDVIYPKEHLSLYEQIKTSGVLLAENPPGTEPQARHFPRRNRIISGLCRGVLVVEANLKSGSLITARMAADQGREVFAIPGSPMDPRAEGPNRLIRDGAHLTTSAEDIITLLKSMDGRQIREPLGAAGIAGAPKSVPDKILDDARPHILELLNPTPTLIDDLIRDSDLYPAAVLTIILELELAGKVERLPGNRVVLLL